MCSEHFETGSSFPSFNLEYNPADKIKKIIPTSTRRKLEYKANSPNVTPPSPVNAEPLPMMEEISIDCPCDACSPQLEYLKEKVSKLEKEKDLLIYALRDCKQIIASKTNRIKIMSSEIQKSKKTIFQKLIKSDGDMLFYTGILIKSHSIICYG